MLIIMMIAKKTKVTYLFQKKWSIIETRIQVDKVPNLKTKTVDYSVSIAKSH